RTWRCRRSSTGSRLAARVSLSSTTMTGHAPLPLRVGIGVGQARWASARGLSDAISQLYEVTHAAEELGLDGVWVGDHILFPSDVDYGRSRYPMTPTGRLAIDTQSTMLE